MQDGNKTIHRMESTVTVVTIPLTLLKGRTLPLRPRRYCERQSASRPVWCKRAITWQEPGGAEVFQHTELQRHRPTDVRCRTRRCRGISHVTHRRACALPLRGRLLRSSVSLYFTTGTCYGMFLPGDQRGWTKWHKDDQVPQPLLADWCRDQFRSWAKRRLKLNQRQQPGPHLRPREHW